MKSHIINKLAVLRLYIIMVLAGLILWVWFPATVDFIGASSLIYALLFALSLGKHIVSFMALAWIPMFISGIIVCYLVAKQRKKYVPFGIMISTELAISFFFLFVGLSKGSFADLYIALIGNFVRVLCYAGMLYYIHHKTGDG